MRPITVTVGPLATAGPTKIALSQTPAGAGALTLNGALVTGAVAIMDTPRRVLITTTDTTTKFTINGLTPTNNALSETVIAVAGSVQSSLDYAQVTSITVNQGTTAAVTVGTNGVASSAWVRLDEWSFPQVGIQCDVSGTVNYTVQSTMDDPNSPTAPVALSAVTWVNTSDAAAVAATAALQTNYLFSPLYVRVLLNSGTGSVTATVVQYNAVSK